MNLFSLPAIILSGIIALVVAINLACSAPSLAVQHAEADAAYAASLLACVDDAGTLAESHACRARVDLAWGVKRPVTVPPAMFVQPPMLLDGGPRDAGLLEPRKTTEGGAP